MAGLGEMQKTIECMGDVRGMGLMVGVELVKDRMTRESAPDLRDRVVQGAFQSGLLLLGCGESTIRFCPPLIVSEGEVDTGLSIFEETLREACRLTAGKWTVCRTVLRVGRSRKVQIGENFSGRQKMTQDLLETLGIDKLNQGAFSGPDHMDCRGKALDSISPVDGRVLAAIRQADPGSYEKIAQGGRSRLQAVAGRPGPEAGRSGPADRRRLPRAEK